MVIESINANNRENVVECHVGCPSRHEQASWRSVRRLGRVQDFASRAEQGAWAATRIARRLLGITGPPDSGAH